MSRAVSPLVYLSYQCFPVRSGDVFLILQLFHLDTDWKKDVKQMHAQFAWGALPMKQNSTSIQTAQDVSKHFRGIAEPMKAVRGANIWN